MSERNLTAPMAAEVQAPVVRPILLYEGEFADPNTEAATFLRLWSGYGSLTWDSKTWTGAGHLLGLSPMGENTELRAEGFSVSLSGQTVEAVSRALQEVRQGKPGKVWLGMLNAAGAVLADPYLVQEGKFDIATIDDPGNKPCVIDAVYEGELIDLDRPRERRWTRDDQSLDYADDRGFDQVPLLQDAVFTWGR